MKLPGSTKNKITKDKNGENLPHLEITEVVLIHCNTVNNDYSQDSRVLYTFVPNNLLVAYCKFLQQIISFKKHLIENMMKLKYGSQIKIVNH